MYTVPEIADYRLNGLAVGDLNGDGIGDIALASGANGLVVLRSTGRAAGRRRLPPRRRSPGGRPARWPRRAPPSPSRPSEPATFACSFDTVAFAPCASPGDLRRPGARAGTSSGSGPPTRPATSTPSPASRTFTVDTRAPETTITGGPSGTITATSATFSFAADEASTFTCALDGGAAVPCTSPAAYGRLGRRRLPVPGAGHRPGRQRRPDAGRRGRFTVQRPSDLGVTDGRHAGAW